MCVVFSSVSGVGLLTAVSPCEGTTRRTKQCSSAGGSVHKHARKFTVCVKIIYMNCINNPPTHTSSSSCSLFKEQTDIQTSSSVRLLWRREEERRELRVVVCSSFT